MMTGRDVFITGLGSYSPGEPVPFDRIEEVLGPLEKIPPKLGSWIERMRPLMKDLLGIKNYYYALDPVTRKPTEDNVTMSVKAARVALDQARIKPEEVDLIIYAGIVMQAVCPPTSVLIQEELKIPYCADLAIHSNCSSIYKAIQVAGDLIANGRYRNALIMTAQISSAFLRAEHFNQAKMEKSHVLLRWFLCDGAGALVLSGAPQPGTAKLKIKDTYIESVGLGLGPDMYCLVGGVRSNPLEAYENGWHHLQQNFENVARLAPRLGQEALDNMIAKTGLDMAQVKYFFANIPTKHLSDMVVESLRKGRQLDHIEFYTRLAERGYPGPCAIIIALDEFLRERHPPAGETLVSMVTESSKWMHGGFILETV
jgi:3-oxoacyl-[acyl-carrier-protein] synthase III